MKEEFYIGEIMVHSSWMGYNIITNNLEHFEMISRYLFEEGFVSNNQIVMMSEKTNS